jgi:hypothetical protein
MSFKLVQKKVISKKKLNNVVVVLRDEPVRDALRRCVENTGMSGQTILYQMLEHCLNDMGYLAKGKVEL